MIATFATLFFVPTVFSLLHSRRHAREDGPEAAQLAHAT
jgi:hypothetical protein